MKTVAQTVIEADRFYTIAAHTGNVIQAVEASKDGGTVRLGKYDHKPEDEWCFVWVGEGVYRIRNRAFGKMLDLHQLWTDRLPVNLPLRVAYFALSYLLICFGIALSNRCRMPIIPTDLFPRELASITGWPYARIKVSFDLICLGTTAVMTLVFLGRLDGLGIGTVLAAATMGKAIAWIGGWMDRYVTFTSILDPAK